MPPVIRTLHDLPSASFAGQAVVTAGWGLSHAQLRQTVGRVATEFCANGVAPATPVGIVLPNTISFTVSFLAATWVRAVAAPLNPSYTADEFRFYIDDARIKVIIVPPNEGAIARQVAKEVNIPVWEISERDGDVHLSTGGSPIGARLPVAVAEGEDTALLLHTSGTTSKPKCVPLSHTNLVTTLGNIIATYDLSEQDKSLLVMPLFHVHGLMAALLSTLASGGTVVFPTGGKFSASTFWADVQKHGVTWYTAVPTIHQVLLQRAAEDFPKQNSPQLRFIRSCSSSLAPAILERLEATFNAPVLEAYAMTEAAHQMTSNPLPSRGPHKAGTVGIGQNVRIAILDPENRALPTGKIGEVCIQGRNVTKGYLNNPKANEEAFAGGWFHTGDQGFLDSEGYLTLTGRIKELINRGGEKISPLEVDAALLGIPQVADAVCFGAPDVKYGEEVHAAVVLKEGQSLSEQQIQAALKGKIADFKIPKRVHITKVMPRTATGKIQRRIVAQHFSEKKAKL
eukprot:TRINITY_DN6660_c0_g1_i1.p1 TRINITY_DN6660_c0_g1~~TRINITY_DN6660_c0_g1_i1.p1  ORF type:complete len:512 (-),score=94.57 TRINITY_DN6660_c0_g1_i1:24-1559(-)